MTSALNTKITSYTLRRGIEFDQATPTTTTTPTRTGTASLGVGAYAGTVYSSNGPAGGSGSWVITANATTGTLSSSLRWANSASSNEGSPYVDADYSMGFWFKLNNLSTTSTSAIHTLINAGGDGCGVTVTAAGGNYTAVPRSLQIRAGGINYQTPSLTLGQWYYFAARRVSGGNTAIYLNGSILTTMATTLTTTLGSLFIGNQSTTIAGNPQYQISNYYVTDSSIIDATAISEIWTVGSTSPNNLKYWNGTAWTVPTNKYQWDGINWVTMVGKYWNGTTWTTIT